MTYTMPTVDSTLTTNLSEIAKDFLNRISLKNGKIRASKPQNDGEAAYVWRMVVFYCSRNPKHRCMPVCADFDLVWPRNDEYEAARKEYGFSHPRTEALRSESYAWRTQRRKELELIVDEILKVTGIRSGSGAVAFGRALGMI
jgi:hypothetical protein